LKEDTTIAVDIAKNVFENAVSLTPGCVSERRRSSRAQMLAFFRNHPPVTVVLKACGAAHTLARELEEMGHRREQSTPERSLSPGYAGARIHSPRSPLSLSRAAALKHIYGALKVVQSLKKVGPARRPPVIEGLARLTY